MQTIIGTYYLSCGYVSLHNSFDQQAYMHRSALEPWDVNNWRIPASATRQQQSESNVRTSPELLSLSGRARRRTDEVAECSLAVAVPNGKGGDELRVGRSSHSA